MPEEAMWKEFFNPESTLKAVEITNRIEKFIDIGCGYGTFLMPAAQTIAGQAIGVDINPDHLELCESKAAEHELENIELFHGNIARLLAHEVEFLKEADYVSLFNILHCEEPVELLGQAASLLKTGGKIGVTHWIYDDTPRGPSFDIRPKPETILKWGESVGLTVRKQVDLPPYHFGIVFEKE